PVLTKTPAQVAVNDVGVIGHVGADFVAPAFARFLRLVRFLRIRTKRDDKVVLITAHAEITDAEVIIRIGGLVYRKNKLRLERRFTAMDDCAETGHFPEMLGRQ